MDFDRLLARHPLHAPTLSVIVRSTTTDWTPALDRVSSALEGRTEPDEIILYGRKFQDPPPAHARGRRVKCHASAGPELGLSSAIALAKHPVVVTLSDRAPLTPAQLDDMIHRLALADICVGTRKGAPGWFRRPVDTLWRFILGLPVRDPLSGVAGFRRELIERFRLDCQSELAWIELFAKATYAVCLFDEVELDLPAEGDTIGRLFRTHPADARSLLSPGAFLKEGAPRGWMNEVAELHERNQPREKLFDEPSWHSLSRFGSRRSPWGNERASGLRTGWGWAPRRLRP